MRGSDGSDRHPAPSMIPFLRQLSMPQAGETILLLAVAISFLAVLSGCVLATSSDVVLQVVKALAWIKGVSLDEQFFGLPRSTLWENQLRRFGATLTVWGGLIGLCFIIVMIFRRPRDLRTDILRGVVFFSAFCLGWYLREGIALPFSNPLGIVGPLVQLRQNPADNLLRYLFVVLVPTVAVVAFDLLRKRGVWRLESEPVPARALPLAPGLLATLCAVGLVVLVAGESYTWHRQVPLDTFHEGESLGPAVHWENGQSPYKDFVIVHGPFQDPLRAVLAYELFGRSIAASRTLESLLEIAALCLYALLVVHVFEWDAGLSALAIASLFVLICLKPFGFGLTVPHRDITLFLFLFSLISLYRQLRRHGNRLNYRSLGLFFLASAIPLASFAYSTERGLYLTIGATLAITLLMWVFVKRWSMAYLAAVAGGAVAGTCLLGLSIRWAFPEFLSHVFVMLPQVHGLGFSLPYPFESTFGIAPVILTALNLAWLAHRFVVQSTRMPSFREAVRRYAETNFVEILLFVLGLLFYVSALGRAGEGHIYYSGGLVFLLSVVILFRHFAREALAQFSVRHRFRFGIGVVLVTAGVVLYLIPGIHASQWFRFPLGASDDEAIGENYRNAVDFIGDSLSAQSQFLTLTSEGVWEYFLGRPSPTRFPIVIYALPVAYQDELVMDMETGHVDMILRKNNYSANGVDSISFEKRLPRVARYISENFESYRTFEDQELWRRKHDH